MPFSQLIKLVTKAFKFTVNRPIQRFNINNRAKKYLGPDAKYFTPAPRAIGPLSQIKGKHPQYPHLEDGSFKSVKQKRLEALERAAKLPELSLEPRSFSSTEKDDSLVIEATNKLEINKIVTKVLPTRVDGTEVKLIDAEENNKGGKERPARPLPKLTNLQLQDPASIWIVDKTPPGRLNLNMLTEMMVNKLADDKYWTPKMIAERYQIKEEYAESLIKYLAQFRIVVSPRLAKALDYVSRDNELYNATKDIIYYADKNMRTDFDKQADKMFLPGEELDEEVRNVIDTNLEPKVIKKILHKPEPLRIGPINEDDKTKLTKVPAQKKLKALNKSDSSPIT